MNIEINSKFYLEAKTEWRHRNIYPVHSHGQPFLQLGAAESVGAAAQGSLRSLQTVRGCYDTTSSMHLVESKTWLQQVI